MTTGLGCDIGGTFTDFALVNDETGQIDIHKCLTTPADPSMAIEEGTRALRARRPGSIGETDFLIHGTTLVINAVIERKGAKTGLITTEGFRDTLAIGREKRYDGYDLQIAFPKPLVNRALRQEVSERLHVSGDTLAPLDMASARNAVGALIEAGVESIAVCLLHAYRNPAHEQKIRDLISEMAPDMPISLSSDVLPELNEYDRTSTTVVNAYAKPVTADYLTRIENRMGDHGFTGELLLMLSSGGITSVDTAREFPVQIIESGPAAGALGAAYYAKLAGIEQVLSFDMGGTTAKMCLVQGGEVSKTMDFEVAHVHRFKKGSGIPVRIPVVDLMEIGAGGGSIAWVTEVGTIQVGPESSGAEPGPACYGQGGERPTVSDADLVLGYLDAEHFLGGEMALDARAAGEAIHNHIAGPLSLDLADAAFGIHGIVNENMASAAKVYVTEHGEDPSQYTLVAFGGAGPVHAVDLARRLGCPRILIPPRAGVASALGMIVAPISYDTVRSHRMSIAGINAAGLSTLYDEMAAECRERMPSGIDASTISYHRSVDMRYAGQGYDVNVPLGDSDLTEPSLRTRFNGVYEKLYGRVYDDLALDVVNFRLTASAPPKQNLADGNRSGSVAAKPVRSRNAYCPAAGGFRDHAVYRRADLGQGFAVAGPAIIEEDESTTIVGSDGHLTVDGHGSLIITLAGKGA